MKHHQYTISEHGDLCISWHGDEHRTQIFISKEELESMTPSRLCYWFSKVFWQGSEWRAEDIRYSLGIK